MFKLDADFDLLIDQDCTHVWRPVGFESLANLTEEVKKAVPKSILRISSELPFLNLDRVKSYAESHPRAA